MQRLKAFVLIGLWVVASVAAAGNSVEGGIGAFLGEGEFDVWQVYEAGRFPNVVVAVDGTVLTMWQWGRVRRSVDGGRTGVLRSWSVRDSWAEAPS